MDARTRIFSKRAAGYRSCWYQRIRNRLRSEKRRGSRVGSSIVHCRRLVRLYLPTGSPSCWSSRRSRLSSPWDLPAPVDGRHLWHEPPALVFLRTFSGPGRSCRMWTCASRSVLFHRNHWLGFGHNGSFRAPSQNETATVAWGFADHLRSCRLARCSTGDAGYTDPG